MADVDVVKAVRVKFQLEPGQEASPPGHEAWKAVLHKPKQCLALLPNDSAVFIRKATADAATGRTIIDYSASQTGKIDVKNVPFKDDTFKIIALATLGGRASLPSGNTLDIDEKCAKNEEGVWCARVTLTGATGHADQPKLIPVGQLLKSSLKF